MNRVQFFELADELGVHVEYLPGGVFQGRRRAAEFMVDAPEGKIFGTSGCHVDGSISHDLEDDGTETKWARAAGELKDIAASIQDCPDGAECDVCRPDPEPGG